MNGFQISCKNLNLGYDNHVVAKNINFEVNAGDYLCIVGENGSGKSTLVKTLLSLNKPVSGEIIFGDVKRNEIGYLPQQTIIQKDFPASVREIIISGCQKPFKPFYTKNDYKRCEENIERLNITSFVKKSYKDLSGGQQQRVLLARALCATEKMLLLDEPVAGLDPIVTEEMYNIIEKLNREGITIIMISHDIKSALKYANKILHVGPNVFFGSKDEYLKLGHGNLVFSNK